MFLRDKKFNFRNFWNVGLKDLISVIQPSVHLLFWWSKTVELIDSRQERRQSGKNDQLLITFITSQKCIEPKVQMQKFERQLQMFVEENESLSCWLAVHFFPLWWSLGNSFWSLMFTNGPYRIAIFIILIKSNWN